jgi:uncharacterized membrane protein
MSNQHRNITRKVAGGRRGVFTVLLCALGALQLADNVHASSPIMVLAFQVSDERIDSVGDAVMYHNDFRSLRRRLQDPLPASDPDRGFLNAVTDTVGSFFSSIFSAIGDFFDALFSGSSQPRNTARQSSSTSSGSTAPLEGVGKLLMVLIIVAILAILIVIVALAVKSQDRKRAASATQPADNPEDLSNLSVAPGETTAATYEARAVQLAAHGNYRAAIRELLLGAMSWIERDGSIRYRRGLTNRDYLRSVWRRTEKRNAFGVVALAFEQIHFGRREPTEEMFDQSLRAFQEAFREEETANSAI